MSAYEKLSSSRREFIRNSSLLIACQIAGQTLHISPAEAARRAVPTRFFSQNEAKTLGCLSETLVPGATAAGVVNFIDSQVSGDPNESLLIARYFNVPPPLGDFYRGGLAALDVIARKQQGEAFAALKPQSALKLAAELLGGSPSGWEGPPAPLFYQCVRSDAVDVVYGTPAGFEAIGIPYMQHILPPSIW
jgi:hypothetical protein